MNWVSMDERKARREKKKSIAKPRIRQVVNPIQRARRRLIAWNDDEWCHLLHKNNITKPPIGEVTSAMNQMEI